MSVRGWKVLFVQVLLSVSLPIAKLLINASSFRKRFYGIHVFIYQEWPRALWLVFVVCATVSVRRCMASSSTCSRWIWMSQNMVWCQTIPPPPYQRDLPSQSMAVPSSPTPTLKYSRYKRFPLFSLSSTLLLIANAKCHICKWCRINEVTKKEKTDPEWIEVLLD